jgi:hypothetical protein
MDNFEELFEQKMASDRRQRIITILIIVVSFIVVFMIFHFTTKTKNANETLSQKLDTAVYNAQKLTDTLKMIASANAVECIGMPTGAKTASGLPLYDFTFKINDKALVHSLSSVDYYFDNDTYNPKLKTVASAQNNFEIVVKGCWGCMSILPVYLHFKDSRIDTIYFHMCEKSRINLPRLQ